MEPITSYRPSRVTRIETCCGNVLYLPGRSDGLGDWPSSASGDGMTTSPSLISLVMAAAALTLPAGAAAAAPKPGTVQSEPVASAAPGAKLVKESFVRIY